MLGSITPLGERGRGQRWGITVGAHLAGSAVGGALTGAAFGLLGLLTVEAADVPITVRLGAVAAVLLVAVSFDLGMLGRLPSLRRQVDETWLATYRGWVYGMGFGLQLGTGLMTVVTTATVYALAAAAVLSGSPLAGMAIGATFGAVRGGTLLSAARVETMERVVAIDGRLRAWDRPSRRLAVAAQLAAVCVLVVVVATS